VPEICEILAFERLRQKDHEFKASLSYIVRPYLKKKKKKIQVRNDWGRITAVVYVHNFNFLKVLTSPFPTKL
jgi:hypothetical protein